MRRKRNGRHWHWALGVGVLVVFGVALASGGCDAVSGIDDLAFERGPGTFCESFDDCADGNYCDYEDRVCRPQLPLGAECTANEQCASEEARTGRCAHNFCCNGPCTGDCFACDNPGEEGTCLVLSDYTDPHDDCPGTTGCGDDGQCQGHVEWTKAYGDAHGDVATGVAFDLDGNMVVVGTFHDSIHFGDALQTSAGSSDVFVAKLEREGGKVSWSRSFGGTGVETAAGVAVDSLGNVWVAGDFEGSATFGTPLVAEARDAFVMKLDPNGNVLDVWPLGPAGDQRASAITIDKTDRVIVTGSFVGTIDYGDSNPGGATGSEDAFVVVYQANGDVAWHRELGGVADVQRGRALAADSRGDVIVAIDGRGTMLSPTDNDAYVLRLDAVSGAPAPSQLSFDGAGDQYASGVAVDSRDRVWITGSFSDRIKAPGGPELQAVDDLDGYFAVFTPVFDHERSEAFGGKFDDVPLAMAIDLGDEVTIVGSFQLDLGVGEEGAVRGRGFHDIFVLKLTSGGEHQWAEAFGGLLFDQALAVAAAPARRLVEPPDPLVGQLAVVGSFQDSVDVGGTVLAADGDSDLYAALLAP